MENDSNKREHIISNKSTNLVNLIIDNTVKRYSRHELRAILRKYIRHNNRLLNYYKFKEVIANFNSFKNVVVAYINSYFEKRKTHSLSYYYENNKFNKLNNKYKRLIYGDKFIKEPFIFLNKKWKYFDKKIEILNSENLKEANECKEEKKKKSISIDSEISNNNVINEDMNKEFSAFNFNYSFNDKDLEKLEKIISNSSIRLPDFSYFDIYLFGNSKKLKNKINKNKIKYIDIPSVVHFLYTSIVISYIQLKDFHNAKFIFCEYIFFKKWLKTFKKYNIIYQKGKHKRKSNLFDDKWTDIILQKSEKIQDDTIMNGILHEKDKINKKEEEKEANNTNKNKQEDTKNKSDEIGKRQKDENKEYHSNSNVNHSNYNNGKTRKNEKNIKGTTKKNYKVKESTLYHYNENNNNNQPRHKQSKTCTEGKNIKYRNNSKKWTNKKKLLKEEEKCCKHISSIYYENKKNENKYIKNRRSRKKNSLMLHIDEYMLYLRIKYKKKSIIKLMKALKIITLCEQIEILKKYRNCLNIKYHKLYNLQKKEKIFKNFNNGYQQNYEFYNYFFDVLIYFSYFKQIHILEGLLVMALIFSKLNFIDVAMHIYKNIYFYFYYIFENYSKKQIVADLSIDIIKFNDIEKKKNRRNKKRKETVDIRYMKNATDEDIITYTSRKNISERDKYLNINTEEKANFSYTQLMYLNKLKDKNKQLEIPEQKFIHQNGNNTIRNTKSMNYLNKKENIHEQNKRKMPCSHFHNYPHFLKDKVQINNRNNLLNVIQDLRKNKNFYFINDCWKEGINDNQWNVHFLNTAYKKGNVNNFISKYTIKISIYYYYKYIFSGIKKHILLYLEILTYAETKYMFYYHNYNVKNLIFHLYLDKIFKFYDLNIITYQRNLYVIKRILFMNNNLSLFHFSKNKLTSQEEATFHFYKILGKYFNVNLIASLDKKKNSSNIMARRKIKEKKEKKEKQEIQEKSRIECKKEKTPMIDLQDSSKYQALAINSTHSTVDNKYIYNTEAVADSLKKNTVAVGTNNIKENNIEIKNPKIDVGVMTKENIMNKKSTDMKLENKKRNKKEENKNNDANSGNIHFENTQEKKEIKIKTMGDKKLNSIFDKNGNEFFNEVKKMNVLKNIEESNRQTPKIPFTDIQKKNNDPYNNENEDTQNDNFFNEKDITEKKKMNKNIFRMKKNAYLIQKNGIDKIPKKAILKKFLHFQNNELKMLVYNFLYIHIFDENFYLNTHKKDLHEYLNFINALKKKQKIVYTFHHLLNRKNTLEDDISEYKKFIKEKYFNKNQKKSKNICSKYISLHKISNQKEQHKKNIHKKDRLNGEGKEKEKEGEKKEERGKKYIERKKTKETEIKLTEQKEKNKNKDEITVNDKRFSSENSYSFIIHNKFHKNLETINLLKKTWKTKIANYNNNTKLNIEKYEHLYFLFLITEILSVLVLPYMNFHYSFICINVKKQKLISSERNKITSDEDNETSNNSKIQQTDNTYQIQKLEKHNKQQMLEYNKEIINGTHKQEICHNDENYLYTSKNKVKEKNILQIELKGNRKDDNDDRSNLFYNANKVEPKENKNMQKTVMPNETSSNILKSELKNSFFFRHQTKRENSIKRQTENFKSNEEIHSPPKQDIDNNVYYICLRDSGIIDTDINQNDSLNYKIKNCLERTIWSNYYYCVNANELNKKILRKDKYFLLKKYESIISLAFFTRFNTYLIFSLYQRLSILHFIYSNFNIVISILRYLNEIHCKLISQHGNILKYEEITKTSTDKKNGKEEKNGKDISNESLFFYKWDDDILYSDYIKHTYSTNYINDKMNVLKKKKILQNILEGNSKEIKTFRFSLFFDIFFELKVNFNCLPNGHICVQNCLKYLFFFLKNAYKFNFFILVKTKKKKKINKRKEKKTKKKTKKSRKGEEKEQIKQRTNISLNNSPKFKSLQIEDVFFRHEKEISNHDKNAIEVEKKKWNTSTFFSSKKKEQDNIFYKENCANLKQKFLKEQTVNHENFHKQSVDDEFLYSYKKDINKVRSGKLFYIMSISLLKQINQNYYFDNIRQINLIYDEEEHNTIKQKDTIKHDQNVNKIQIQNVVKNDYVELLNLSYKYIVKSIHIDKHNILNYYYLCIIYLYQWKINKCIYISKHFLLQNMFHQFTVPFFLLSTVVTSFRKIRYNNSLHQKKKVKCEKGCKNYCNKNSTKEISSPKSLLCLYNQKYEQIVENAKQNAPNFFSYLEDDEARLTPSSKEEKKENVKTKSISFFPFHQLLSKCSKTEQEQKNSTNEKTNELITDKENLFMKEKVVIYSKEETKLKTMENRKKEKTNDCIYKESFNKQCFLLLNKAIRFFSNNFFFLYIYVFYLMNFFSIYDILFEWEKQKKKKKKKKISKLQEFELFVDT